jgi:hypothetical protein
MGDDWISGSGNQLRVNANEIGAAFVFYLPDQVEFLRVEKDGRCYVRGECIEKNEDVWQTFKQWLARIGVDRTALPLAIEIAWGIIANAFDGDWSKASDEWRQAAERWRDEYIRNRSKGDGASQAALSVRALSDEQLLQALKNFGCHVADCDACSAIFFTGAVMNEKHTCPRGR